MKLRLVAGADDATASARSASCLHRDAEKFLCASSRAQVAATATASMHCMYRLPPRKSFSSGSGNPKKVSARNSDARLADNAADPSARGRPPNHRCLAWLMTTFTPPLQLRMQLMGREGLHERSGSKNFVVLLRPVSLGRGAVEAHLAAPSPRRCVSACSEAKEKRRRIPRRPEDDAGGARHLKDKSPLQRAAIAGLGFAELCVPELKTL